MESLITMANAGLIDDDAYQFIRGNNPDGTPNPERGAMVDVVSLADYMILISMEVTGIGSPQLGSHQKRVSPGKGFRFFSWDAEHMVEGLNANILSENNDKCPSPGISAITSE